MQHAIALVFFIAVISCSAQNERVVCNTFGDSTYCNVYNDRPVGSSFGAGFAAEYVPAPAVPQYSVDSSCLYLQQMYLQQLRDDTSRLNEEAELYRERLRLDKEREALEQERRGLNEYLAWRAQYDKTDAIPPREDLDFIRLEKKPSIVLANPKFVKAPTKKPTVLQPDQVEFEKPQIPAGFELEKQPKRP